MVFAPIKEEIKHKILECHLVGHGRNAIDRQLKEQGIRVSHGSISNVINKYKKNHEQSLQSNATIIEQSSSLPPQPEAIPISTATYVKNIGSPVSVGAGLKPTIVTPRDGGPLSHLLQVNPDSTNLIPEFVDFHKSYPEFYPATKDSTSKLVGSISKPTKKIYPRDPIEEELRIEGGKAWQYYGAAQTRILEQINKEKDRRRHELFLIDSRKGKLEEWRKKLDERESNLKDREARVRSFEPYLILAKKLCKMKLRLGDALYWTQTINEVAQIKNMDIRSATVYVAQELRQYRQLGGLEKKSERANQELTLINMAAIKKQEALTVVEDLINNKGITSEQIAQLNWNKHNGNPPSGNNNPNTEFQQTNNGGPSMNDYLRLQLLQASLG